MIIHGILHRTVFGTASLLLAIAMLVSPACAQETAAPETSQMAAPVSAASLPAAAPAPAPSVTTSSSAAAGVQPQHPELLRFKNDGGEVTFLGHAYGLDGWLLTKDDMPPQAAYTTAEGGMVMGPLINTEGTVETAKQLSLLKARAEGRAQDALPGADLALSAPAEKFYAEVEKSGWVKAGDDKAPYIYMFMNTGCDHCQNYWKDLQPAIKDGRVQVRLVPFGALEQNRLTGAALLASTDPAAAWTSFMNGDKAALSAPAAPENLAKIDANGALLKKWKVKDTPFTVYRRLNDGTVTVVSGRPENVMLILADLMK